MCVCVCVCVCFVWALGLGFAELGIGVLSLEVCGLLCVFLGWWLCWGLLSFCVERWLFCLCLGGSRFMGLWGGGFEG